MKDKLEWHVTYKGKERIQLSSFETQKGFNGEYLEEIYVVEVLGLDQLHINSYRFSTVDGVPVGSGMFGEDDNDYITSPFLPSVEDYEQIEKLIREAK